MLTQKYNKKIRSKLDNIYKISLSKNVIDKIEENADDAPKLPENNN